MTFYAIRHIKTQLLMPEVRTRGGYSHWNPDNPKMPDIFFNEPRLFDHAARAKRCITQWFVNQNGRRHFTQNTFTGEYDDIMDYKEDGRKKEDLEVVEVELRIKK